MEFDAIVVGSGLCGSLATQALEERGLRVLVIEAGPDFDKPLPGEVAPLQKAVASHAKVTSPDWAFRGPTAYEWHRVRARGGRTLLWGGWMERPVQDYFEARRRMGAAWPVPLENLDTWVRQAEKRLTVCRGKPGALHGILQRLGVRADVKREAVLLGRRRMLTAPDLALKSPVLADHPVLSIEKTSRHLLIKTGRGETYSARRVILAASPVETARIIEASLPTAARKGRFDLHDHLIAGAIAIAPRFPHRAHPRNAAEPSAVVYPDPGQRIRFTLEVRGPTPLEQLDDEDLRNLGYSREEARKLSFFVVFAMGETDPLVPRAVVLDERERDSLGRPIPTFVQRAHTGYEKRLARQMNARVLRLARELARSRKEAFCIYDANDFSSGGHETGTCLSRVTPSGEVMLLPGVFVADGAGVPGATDRHPSLTLAANALRVADSVAARWW